ncbi:MAG TPA: VWA domain-containing protein [Pirellulales bacterium]|nr:VWA domain-containing protein [Pirellulales bacterium]
MNDDQPRRTSQRDIQLTAYALGEMNDAEQAEFAATSDEAERIASDDIARLGGLLRRSVREEACPTRSDDLRRAVEARLMERETVPSVESLPITLPPSFWPRRRVWLPLSLAASLLVIGATVVTLLNLPADVRQVAMNDLEGRMRDDVDDRPSVVGSTDELELVEDGFSVIESGAESVSDLESSASSSVADPYEVSDPVEGASLALPFRDEQIRTEPKAREEIDRELYSRNGAGDQTGGPSQGGGQRNTQEDPSGGISTGFSDQELDREIRSNPVGGLDGRPEYPGEKRAASNVRGRAVGVRGEASGEGGRHRTPRDTNRRRAVDDRGEASGKGSGGGRPSMQGAGFGGPRMSGRGVAGGGMAGGPGATGGGGGGMQGGGGMKGSGGSGMTGGGMAGGQPPPIVGQGAPLGFNGNFALTNTEDYDPITENPFLSTGEHALSTFSIDVDTASYANMRRFINTHALPPPNAVRIEEMINYFSYDYPQPEGDDPFSVTTEVAGCPWNADHRLLRVGLKGRELDPARRPASNLVFLLDVSGSMDEPNKLPLVKEALQLLTRQLGENDRVAIVVYAGNSGLVLPPTRGDQREKICEAIASLVAGGSTNGGQGIQLAYEAAQAHFVPGGTNRVILATDGDFNVGVTDTADLVRLIEEKAACGVGLSALGFGAGNLKDAMLEKLADRGNGNYAYIDTAGEARKVLVEQLCGTLVTIAKDVKLQLEFNPAQVGAYRLIGYENRLLREQDFNDDRKDAGEIGAGHAVTALYELVPAGEPAPGGTDALKYQRVPQLADAAARDELATLKLRYKPPEGEKSKHLEHVITDTGLAYGRASPDFKFAASVAACGMLLRGSQYAGSATWDAVIELAGEGQCEDPHGYRSEFLELVKKAKAIAEP